MNGRTNAYGFARLELEVLAEVEPDSPMLAVKDQILELCEAFGNSGQSGGSAPYVARAVAEEVAVAMSSGVVLEMVRGRDSVHLGMAGEISALCDGLRLAGVGGVRRVCDALVKLFLFEPLTQVTGVDSEWADVSHLGDGQSLYQNRRCPAVFKKGRHGTAYYLDAMVKRDGRGVCWTGWCWLSREDYLAGDRDRQVGSKGYIKSFPFEPKTFYVDVVDVEVAKDDWESFVKDPLQLDEFWEYYDRYGKGG